MPRYKILVKANQQTSQDQEWFSFNKDAIFLDYVRVSYAVSGL